MAQIPATVTIPQLPQATTLTLAEVIEAVQTTGGVANSVQIPLSSIATTLFGNLPQGGGTGQLLEKTGGSNFVSAWTSISSLVTASTNIGITGSTAIAVAVSSSPTFAGQVIANATTGQDAFIAFGNSQQGLVVNNGTGAFVRAVASSASAAYNGIVIAGDASIIFAGPGGEGTGALSIAPWNTTTAGLRITAAGNVQLSAYSTVGVLKTDGTGNVTSLSGLLGQILQAQGTTLPPIWASAPVLKIQNFTASGTYTASSGLLYAIMFTVGGGAGGGGVTGLAGQSLGGGGGGSGGISIAVVSAGGVGVSQAVTIGVGGAGVSAGTGAVGGTTSIGVFCMARGGLGGLPNNGTSVFGGGGVGGTAGTGTVSIVGAQGGIGGFNLATTSLAISGYGAASFFGGGGSGQNAGNAAASGGLGGTVSGSGGSGGAVTGTTSTVAGGSGANGQAFIIELTAF